MVGRRTRVALLLVLSLYVATSFAGVEAWPVTGWRLYSRGRSASIDAWKVQSVDGSGEEHAIPWDRLPIGYRTTYDQLRELLAGPPGDFEAACDAWAAAVRDLGEEVVELRVYRVQGRRAFDRDRGEVSRELLESCGRPAEDG